MKLGEHPAHLSGRLPSWTVFQALVLCTSLRSPPLHSGGRLARSSSGGLRDQRPRVQWQATRANVSTKRRFRGGGAAPSGADPNNASWEKTRSCFAPWVCGPVHGKKRKVLQLHVPKGETFPIPLKYIDVTRTTHTILDVLQESRIDDYGNVVWIEVCQTHGQGFTKFTILSENRQKS